MEQAPTQTSGTMEKAAATPAPVPTTARPAESLVNDVERPQRKRHSPLLKPNWRKRALAAGLALAAIGAGFWLTPLVRTSLTTVSTDDAYVNGHVTFVAPRVAGQVVRVLVEDNYRVEKGDLLVELDKEPYQVQVAIKTAAVGAAESDLAAAEAQAHGLAAQARSNRFNLEHAI